MTTPCEQEAKIAKIDTELSGVKDSLKSIDNKILWFIGIYATGVIAILVPLLIGIFHLGEFNGDLKDIKEEVKEIPTIKSDVRYNRNEIILLKKYHRE